MPANPRIFISYSHRDGGELATRLAADLAGRAYQLWLDRERLPAGNRWTNSIEAAIDHADIVLALLSEGSFVSDICRAEQVWALNERKRVIPLRVFPCKAPLHLSHLHFLDFGDPAGYDAAMDELLRAIGRPETPETPLKPHCNAPALPNHFVERPELLAGLRDALFAEGPRRNIGLTALQGMGGVGKTVLAQTLCADRAAQCAYPDGIFWFTVGRESRLSFDQRVEGVPGMKRLLGSYTDEAACLSQYRDALREKAALIVLDDVWSAADIEPFRIESPRSRLLFTTRDAGLAPSFGAFPFPAGLFSDAQSREALARWAGLDSGALPREAGEIIRECGNLPLALAMIGAQLNGKPSAHWQIVLGHLRRADLDKIRARFPEPHTTLLRAIEVSVEALRRDNPLAGARYGKLAVLLEDMAAPPAIERVLWGCGEAEALETSERFVELSLATRDEPSGGIRLHDLLLDYTRMQYGAPESLPLIHGAIRLSAHVLDHDPAQFAPQLVGRLLPHRDDAAILQFTEEIAAAAPRPWLRPLFPALHPPGTGLLRLLEGHSGWVNDVAVTPDGLRAVSASVDGTLRFWDLETGRVLRILEGHSAWVSGVAVTPDGKRAVSASWDKTLRVWDLETGTTLRTLEGHSDGVRSVEVTPDGKRALSASGDGTLRVWDLGTGQALFTLEGHALRVNGLAVTPDGKRAISASSDKTLKVWELEKGHLLRMLEDHTDSVQNVAVTPDGKRAVSASSDKTLKVWDLETGRVLRTLEGHSLSVNGVAVTPDGKQAVSASWDRTLKIWDLETGALLRTLEGHSNSINNVAITPDGKRAVSASEDESLGVWNLESAVPLRALESHSGGINGLAVSPDGKRLVSASSDKTLRVWNLETRRTLRKLRGHSGSVTGVAITPDGRRAVSASSDMTLRVWDLESGVALRKLTSHTDRVRAVAVTPDGQRAVSASWDKSLMLWDLETGAALRVLEGRSGRVDGVAVTPDGKRAVSACWDNTLKFWDLETGIRIRSLEGHGSYVNGVAVTPDGKRAVSASWDETLKLWDLATGRLLRTLVGHSDSVKGVAITPNGRHAVSASDDKTVRVWDLETGCPLAAFHCDASPSCCVCVDDRNIVAGDDLGRLHFLVLEE
jgi:WD40 repeat protein